MKRRGRKRGRGKGERRNGRERRERKEKKRKKKAFGKELLETGWEDLGSGNCLEGLIMIEENRINQVAGGQFSDKETK